MDSVPAADPEPGSLRDAQRALTRRLLMDAAREQFFRKGFEAATVDDIARAAGTRRSTLYAHFADKAEILAAIVEAYTTALCAVIREAPGPRPSRPELDAWLERLARFVAEQRTPTVLLSNLGDGPDAPPPVQTMSRVLIQALAERIPAFGAALSEGPDGARAAARTALLLRNLAWAWLQGAQDGGERGRALLGAVADDFHRFVMETEAD